MRPKKENATHILSREMHALEVNAEYFGISLLQLMETAGHNVAVKSPHDSRENKKSRFSAV